MWLLSISMLFACLPVVLLAADPIAASPLRDELNTLPALLNAILDAIILLVFPIVVLMIVYTGLLFVSAGGNEGQISKARTALLWTVIGALVVLGSKALSIALENTVLEIEGAVYEEPAVRAHTYV